MRSKEKLAVYLRKVHGKDWVAMAQLDGGLEVVLSFEDIFRVLHALVYCETMAYRDRVKDPSMKVRMFLRNCVTAANGLSSFPSTDAEYDAAWNPIAKEYDLQPYGPRGDR